MQYKTVLITMILLFFISGCNERLQTRKYASIDENLIVLNKEEIALANRFIEYWDYRSQHQFDKSYHYEFPYYCFITPISKYIGESKTNNKAFNNIILSINYENLDQTIAWIERKYIKNNFSSIKKDKWIYVNGSWFHQYTSSAFPK